MYWIGINRNVSEAETDVKTSKIEGGKGGRGERGEGRGGRRDRVSDWSEHGNLSVVLTMMPVGAYGPYILGSIFLSMTHQAWSPILLGEMNLGMSCMRRGRATKVSPSTY
jgi:hypothetical protein